MKSLEWVHRDGCNAYCSRCGGKSIFVHGVTVNGRLYKYWRWWKEFKRHHAKCVERENYGEEV